MSAPTDRLVTALCSAALADFEACRQEEEGADPRGDLGDAYLHAAVRLSAVLAAARVVAELLDPWPQLRALRDALAAADAEVKP